jgi:hypothetical protein
MKIFEKLKNWPWVRFLSAAVVAVSFVAVLQGTLVDNLFFGVLVFFGYIYARQASLFLLSVCFGMIVAGIVASAVSKIFGVVPHEVIVCLFILAFFFSNMAIRRWTQGNTRNTDSDLVSLIIFGVTALLIWRWPLNSPIDFIGFLSYEDNAAWISTVAAFTPQHTGGFITGSGGFVLDPLMSLIYGIRTVGLSDVKPIVVYEVTAATYGLLQFLAIVTVGLFVVRKLKTTPSGVALQLTAALASMSISYIALQLPRSTGHLTFIGAIALMHVILLLSTILFENKKYFFAATFIVSVGVVGMWWPYLLVVAITLVLMILDKSWTEFWRSTASYLKRPRIIALGIVLLVVTLIAMLPLFTNGFGSMSPLEFFRVSGGVQPVPGYLTLIGTIALGFYYLMAEKKEQIKIGSLFTLALGILLIGIHLVSYFVGPSYTPNYSYNKSLLLFAISAIPLIAVVVAEQITRYSNRGTAAICAIAIFGVGGVTTGWNLNSPREIVAPVWANQLQAMATKYPGSSIFCSTSNPAANFDAYLCSRHSIALQQIDSERGSYWGTLQANPAPTTDTEQLETLRSFLDDLLSQNKKVIILSLDDYYQIADEDKWWMDQLPLDKVHISTPRGEIAN